MSKDLLSILKKVTGNEFAILGNEDGNVTKDYISTGNLLLDYQITGKGGLPNNKITQFVGPFASFKTFICGMIALNALKGNTTSKKKYNVIWCEAEGATSKDNLIKLGFDEEILENFIWLPIESVEDLNSQVYNLLESKQRGVKKDKGSSKLTKIEEDFIIVIDSLGMLGSRKEIQSALSDDGKVDMTRAKAITSFFRLMTKKCELAEVPIFIINHIYKTQDLFSQTIVGGGEKATLGPRYIIEFSKSKLKKSDKIIGANIISKILKSTNTKYGTKVTIPVEFKTGLEYESGLDDFLFKELKITEKPNLEGIKSILIKYFELSNILEETDENI